MTIVTDQTGTRIVFSDVNPETGNLSADELVFNDNAINESILTILDTKKGTRPFRRGFGSNLVDLVFLPITEATRLRIYREIVLALETWEPRIVIDQAEILPDYPGQQWFVELTYRIPALNNKTAVFNFNLSRN